MLEKSFLDAYVADLRNNVKRVRAIGANGFNQEAMLVAMCYIDSLGHDLTGTDRARNNFREALVRCSSDPYWAAVVPFELQKRLDKLVAEKKLRTAVQISPNVLISIEAAKRQISHACGAEALTAMVLNAIDKATVADVLYSVRRSSQVHDYSSGRGPVRFGALTWNGVHAAEIDLDYVCRTLDAIIDWFDQHRDQVALFTAFP